jgi:peptidoglycan hydrolase-like protein with peptidoglycan-binding domain
MTPFRMRLFVIVFLSVAAAIAVNALYLQHAPRLVATAVQEPSRQLTVERTAPTAALPKQDPIITAAQAAPELEPHAAEPVAAREAPPSVPPAAAPPRKPAPPPPARVIRAIQRELQLRGYTEEPATGDLSLSMRAAIVAYEFDEGMPLTGEASEAILKSLIFARAEGRAEPKSAARFEQRRALIAEVQHMLSAMGYAPGPADGRLDDETRNAIRRFEGDRHLSADGQLNERVLLEIVIAAGRPIEASG